MDAVGRQVTPPKRLRAWVKEGFEDDRPHPSNQQMAEKSAKGSEVVISYRSLKVSMIKAQAFD